MQADELDDLDGLLLFLLTLGSLLHLFTRHLFPTGHVGVKDHPLGGFDGEDGPHGRLGLDALGADGQVEGLGGAFLVVELVSQGLLLRDLVLSNYTINVIG